MTAAAACVQVTELKLKVETVERERDFYFCKLRDIEVGTTTAARSLCHAPYRDYPLLVAPKLAS